MSQQLHLFANELANELANEPFSEELPDANHHLLMAQTRQLFHHQGSNAELVERIKTVIQAIDERCK